MRLPRRVAPLVAIAVVACAAACGGSNRTGDTATLHVVKIGVIVPLSGAEGAIGRSIRNSVQLAVNDANARLAIPGWSIQMAAFDDASDPAAGERAATSLASDPAVVGVVGTYDSAVAWRAAPVLNRAGIAMISPANTDPSLTLGAEGTKPRRQFSTYFRLIASNARGGSFLARYVTDRLHAQTAVVVSEARPANRLVADDFGAAFTAAGGDVVLDTTVPDHTERFGDVADSIARLRPDVIFFSGTDTSAAALRSSTSSPAPIVGGDGIKDDAYLRAAGRDAEGDIAATAGAALATSTGSGLYRLAYAAARFTDPPTDFGPYAYDAANLVVNAAGRILLAEPAITSSVRARIVAGVQAARVDAVSGAVAFDAYGDNAGAALTVFRVTHGVWRPILSARSG
jgi:branched-chain amino acid transport system substrate-binding protein